MLVEGITRRLHKHPTVLWSCHSPGWIPAADLEEFRFLRQGGLQGTRDSGPAFFVAAAAGTINHFLSFLPDNALDYISAPRVLPEETRINEET